MEPASPSCQAGRDEDVLERRRGLRIPSGTGRHADSRNEGTSSLERFSSTVVGA